MLHTYKHFPYIIPQHASGTHWGWGCDHTSHVVTCWVQTVKKLILAHTAGTVSHDASSLLTAQMCL